jgi:peptidyl-prolyl cis-trans isomerase B (cyclophilin B)
VSKAGKRERQKENRERAREERERLMRRDRRMKTTRSLLFVLVPIMVILVIISITSSSSNSSASFDSKRFYTATMDTSEGTIVLALDQKTPKATGAFVKWVEEKKYDGLCIDRIARDFVIQGGSPGCTRSGDLGTPVSGEVPTDNYPVGSLAGAKGGTDPAGTFGGQFFVVTGSGGASLPNDYARFGTVIKGLDVAQKIGALPIQGGATDGPPAQKITIKKITVKSSKTAPTTTSTTSPAPTTTTAPATTTTT